MSTKAQVNPPKGVPLPIHHLPETGSPAAGSVTANSIVLSWYPLPTLYTGLARMAVPAPGETPGRQVLRWNTLYISQITASKSFFTPPRAASPKPAVALPNATPTAATASTPPLTAARLAGLPMYELLKHVQATGSFNGVAGLFLTLWNDAALRKDTAQTNLALQLWRKAVSATPASDLPRVLFYDPAVKQMLGLPASSLPKLGADGSLGARWISGATFRKELSAFATTIYDNYFTPTVQLATSQPAAGKLEPALDTAKPTSTLHTTGDVVALFGASFLAGAACAPIVLTDGLAILVTGQACLATSAVALGTLALVADDLLGPSSESQSEPIPPCQCPADVPVQTPDGTIGALPGPVQLPPPPPTGTDSTGNSSSGETGDTGSTNNTASNDNSTNASNNDNSTNASNNDNSSSNSSGNTNASGTDDSGANSSSSSTDTTSTTSNPSQTDTTSNPSQTDTTSTTSNPNQTDTSNSTDNTGSTNTSSTTDTSSSTNTSQSSPQSNSPANSPEDGPGGPSEGNGGMRDELRRRKPPINYQAVKPTLPTRKPGNS